MHEALTDRLFGAPGTWNLFKCVNPECGVIWLNPMPLTEDISVAYCSYYTHNQITESKSSSLFRLLYRRIKSDYIAKIYGYPANRKILKNLNIGYFLHFLPIRRNEVDHEMRHLTSNPGARLLDVGCGSGEWLVKMKALDWDVWGVDFDAEAVRTARNRDLKVELGSLEDQNYPESSFDVIVLNHVIEHLPNPLGTLAKCRQILKPGGKLILFTPNASSLGCCLFKRDWRGLEVPRHLHVFTPEAMLLLLTKAGFPVVNIRTANSRYILRQSVQMRFQTSFRLVADRSGLGVRMLSELLTVIEQIILVAIPNVGECLDVEAVTDKV